MMNPDRELELLEQEFGKSADALVVAPGSAADNRILSVARRHALYLAGRDGDSVDEKAVPPGARPESGRPVAGAMVAEWNDQADELSARSQSLSQLEPETITNARPFLELPRDWPERTGDTASIYGHGSPEAQKELQRLRGRDRETWRQRMAELVLQDNVSVARYLLEWYEHEFAADE